MQSEPQFWFDHEKLDVYQEAISFIRWLTDLMDSTAPFGSVKDQLDRASTSIPLNIAEGNGKYSPKDRCRFFDIAHGSALECAAALDVLVVKRRVSVEQTFTGKESLQKIVRMLFGLIKRHSSRDYERLDESVPPAHPTHTPTPTHTPNPVRSS